MNSTPAAAPSSLASALELFPFDLGPEELRDRADRLLAASGEALERLLVQAGPRTVENFLGPLNRLLVEARDLGLHGNLLFSVHPAVATREAGRSVSEASDRFFHAFRLNARAYEVLRSLDLSQEEATTRFAVFKLLRDMRRAGVEKSPEERERLYALGQAIDATSNRFAENIANQERHVDVVPGPELAGLPPDYLASHPPGPDGKVRLTTRYPDFRPVMAYADSEELRRRLALGFANRAYPDNLAVLAELLRDRHTLARTLGYPDFAAYSVEDKMVDAPEKVQALLDRIAELLRAPGRRYLDRLLARKRADRPGATTVEPWEAAFFGPGYYDEKIRNEEFGVDLRRLRSFLPYGGMREGLFALCRELFGVEFLPSDAPVWHPSVEAYDVRRHGVPLGRAYLDLVPRDGKFNHAACFTVREGLLGTQLPHAALVCNFLVPGEERETARMEYPDLVTFFHEFGHLLHALVGGHQVWFSNSPSGLEWDFIEAPSQLFEEWARDPATLARFAIDPESGTRPSAQELERLKGAAALGRSVGWLRQVAFASIALDLYRADPSGLDLVESSRRSHDRYSPIPMPADYHFVASFGHLTGYGACYYTYAWSSVIARDLLEPFRAAGTLTSPEVAAAYAREILAPGSQRPAAELIRAYLGRDFTFDAFERWATEVPQPASSPAPTPS